MTQLEMKVGRGMLWVVYFCRITLDTSAFAFGSSGVHSVIATYLQKLWCKLPSFSCKYCPGLSRGMVLPRNRFQPRSCNTEKPSISKV